MLWRRVASPVHRVPPVLSGNSRVRMVSPRRRPQLDAVAQIRRDVHGEILGEQIGLCLDGGWRRVDLLHRYVNSLAKLS